MEVHSHLLSGLVYKGGKVNWVDDIDSNIFSIASNRVKEERFIKRISFWRQFATSQVPDFANNDMGSVIPFTGDQNGPISKVKPKSISKKGGKWQTKPRDSYVVPWAINESKLNEEHG
ncbi:hypothetical protein Tco_1385432 [Tanacetum coccineum]